MSFICNHCEQELPNSQLSNQSLRAAHLFGQWATPHKISKREALRILPLEEQVCSLCDRAAARTVIMDENETPRWNWGMAYAAHFGVYVTRKEFTDGEQAALAQSF